MESDSRIILACCLNGCYNQNHFKDGKLMEVVIFSRGACSLLILELCDVIIPPAFMPMGI